MLRAKSSAVSYRKVGKVATRIAAATLIAGATFTFTGHANATPNKVQQVSPVGPAIPPINLPNANKGQDCCETGLSTIPLVTPSVGNGRRNPCGSVVAG